MAFDDPKSVAELAAEIKADHAQSVDAVKEIAEQALAEAKNGKQSSETLNVKADEALTKMNELTERVTEMDQKLARATAFETDRDAAKSLGAQFAEDESVQAFLATEEKRGKAALMLKATISTALTDADGSAGAAVEATRLPGIIAPHERRMTVRDLITPGQMDGSILEYVRETGFNNNAGMVGEGQKKPQSDIQLDLVSTSARVIAHTAKASRQIMDDAAQLRTYIDGRLRYGLAFKEEMQLLNGDGTGQNLMGIVPQASEFNASGLPAASTAIDRIRIAMLQAVLAEYPATGHVLNPIDWAEIEIAKDADGRYLIGNPQGSVEAKLWSLPVVETQAISVGKFLTGAFSLGAQVFDRWQARVEIATENEDDFVKNLITMLCEERLALAVYRPEAFITGDLKPATPAD